MTVFFRPPFLKYLLGIYLPLMLLLSVKSGWAWGPQGHQIVGLIADWHLSAEVKKKIREDFNIKSLADVANWPDQVRDERSQGRWHYANIREKEWTYDKNRDCPDGHCVVEKIHDFSDRLKNRKLPHRQRWEALSYLVHFVSDVHQPLHLGYRRDRGGGKISLNFRGRETNLHALWDGGLIGWKGKSLLQYARDLNRRISREDLKRWMPSNVIDWANESRRLVLTQVYPVRKSKAGRLSKEYIEKSREIIDLRMSQAGVRLAELLEQLIFR